MQTESLLPAGWDEELIALHQRDYASRSRVCAAEAESMATAPSRSPLHVCGGRLHAFEKLFVARCPSIHRWERYEKDMNTFRKRYDLSCPLAQRFTLGGAEQGWAAGVETAYGRRG